MNDALAVVTMVEAGFPRLELPTLKLPNGNTLTSDQALMRAQEDPFDSETVAAAFTNRCSNQAIKNYLQSYPRRTVTEGLNKLVKKHHTITYAIDRNSVKPLQTLLEYSVGVNTKDFDDRIPVLAFAIMRTKWTVRNATDVVKLLLIHGAEPRAVPIDMWEDYTKVPHAVPEKDFNPNRRALWCAPTDRGILAQTLNLSMRYDLCRAYRFNVFRKRIFQMATDKKIIPLLRMPFHLIGQQHATKLVMEKVFAHLMVPSKKPLVLAFVGLSGHGKTELATQMGALLSTDCIDIDCTQARTLFALLGSDVGYFSNEKGSPLNNHLAKHDGERSVIFLDEFDKTENDIREALLKVMDTGMYRDRRTNTDVDASKAIWILATNLGHVNIDRFYINHLDGRREDDVAKISIEPLRRELSKLFIGVFSAPIAGRINVIAPFFPFSKNEQAVVSNKFILELFDEFRQPIDLVSSQKRHVGHIHLHIHDDGKLCEHLASTGYVKEVGARSISNAVSEIKSRLVLEYCRSDEEVEESTNLGPLQRFTVELHPVVEGMEEEIGVFANGETEVSGPE